MCSVPYTILWKNGKRGTCVFGQFLFHSWRFMQPKGSCRQQASAIVYPYIYNTIHIYAILYTLCARPYQINGVRYCANVSMPTVCVCEILHTLLPQFTWSGRLDLGNIRDRGKYCDIYCIWLKGTFFVCWFL